jgi:hypothetical protein
MYLIIQIETCDLNGRNDVRMYICTSLYVRMYKICLLIVVIILLVTEYSLYNFQRTPSLIDTEY